MLNALALLLAAAPSWASARMTPVPLGLGLPLSAAGAGAVGAGLSAGLASPLSSTALSLPVPFSQPQAVLPQVRTVALTPEREAPRAAASRTPAQASPQVIRSAPELPTGTRIQRTASPQELDFAAQASVELARLAEEVGEERGMKASRMTGKDFLDMLEGGRERYALGKAAEAPSPEAFAAARSVQAQVLRWASKLLVPDQPLYPQIRRVLAVWDVFNQEMARAAEQGTLKAVTDDAELFATQVENS